MTANTNGYEPVVRMGLGQMDNESLQAVIDMPDEAMLLDGGVEGGVPVTMPDGTVRRQC